MKSRAKKWAIGVMLFIGIYASGYMLTTTLKHTGGQGGLSGPPLVQSFRSIYHLLAFYPCYLAERTFRTHVLGSISWSVGVEFADGKYPMDFLYGRFCCL